MSSLAAVGSGLDIPTLVSQLVAADRAPTENRINKLGTAATAKVSALGTIKSAMSNVQSSLKSLSESISTPQFKSTVAEGAGFTSSSTSTATVGTYDLKVLELAKAHKLTSTAFAVDSKVGAGTLQISSGDHSFDITVAADMSLSSLAREINRVTEGKGITASVITSDAGQHLVLNATGTGKANAITMTTVAAEPGELAEGEEAPVNQLSKLTWNPGDEDTPASGTMLQTIAATDARVEIDGQERTGTTNSFSDLIEGVTITLTKANPDAAYNLSIASDSSLAKTNLQSFVSTYNATLSALKSASSYNAETNQSSVLTGDSMVRNLQNQMRAILGGNNIGDLKALGISVAKDGVLSFSSGEFDKVRAEQPMLAESIFGKTGSITSSLNNLLTSNLDSTNGVLVKRTETLNKEIKRLERELDDLDVRMEKVYERYTKQFTAMDTIVAQMQSTSDYLTSQLANLNKSTS